MFSQNGVSQNEIFLELVFLECEFSQDAFSKDDFSRSCNFLRTFILSKITFRENPITSGNDDLRPEFT